MRILLYDHKSVYGIMQRRGIRRESGGSGWDIPELWTHSISVPSSRQPLPALSPSTKIRSSQVSNTPLISPIMSLSILWYVVSFAVDPFACLPGELVFRGEDEPGVFREFGDEGVGEPREGVKDARRDISAHRRLSRYDESKEEGSRPPHNPALEVWHSARRLDVNPRCVAAHMDWGRFLEILLPCRILLPLGAAVTTSHPARPPFLGDSTDNQVTQSVAKFKGRCLLLVQSRQQILNSPPVSWRAPIFVKDLSHDDSSSNPPSSTTSQFPPNPSESIYPFTSICIPKITTPPTPGSSCPDERYLVQHHTSDDGSGVQGSTVWSCDRRWGIRLCQLQARRWAIPCDRSEQGKELTSTRI